MNDLNYFISSIMFIFLLRLTSQNCAWGCFLCYSEGDGCAVCGEGYYRIDKSCHSCGPGCSHCTDSTSCYFCFDGYYLTSNECYSCDSNCKTCQSTADLVMMDII